MLNILVIIQVLCKFKQGSQKAVVKLFYQQLKYHIISDHGREYVPPFARPRAGDRKEIL
jgi:hypothetical protein